MACDSACKVFYSNKFVCPVMAYYGPSEKVCREIGIDFADHKLPITEQIKAFALIKLPAT